MQGKEQKPIIRSVKFNVLMNMILSTSSFLFPLITVPYVSRLLGPDGLGLVGWAQTFVSYFAVIASLGIGNYGIREVAKVRNDPQKLSKLVQELMVILLASTSIVYTAYIVLVFFIPRTKEHLPLMLLFSLGIWLSSCGIEWFYQGIEQYGYITVRNIALKIIGLILMFAIVRNNSDYLQYAFVVIVGSYASNIFNLLRLRKYITFRRTRKLNCRRHFKPMFWFSLSTISSTMYGQIDMFLIGFLASPLLVGVYQFVTKLRILASTAVSSVANVMLPRLSFYEASGDHNSTRSLVSKNINVLVIMGLWMAGLLIICRKPLILLLGGSQYLLGADALIIVSPMMIFPSLNTLFSQYMVATDKEKAYSYINLSGLVIGIIYGFIFIPIWGINGAALGVALGEFTVFIIRLVYNRKFVKSLKGHSDTHKSLIVFIISFTITILLTKHFIINNNLLFVIVYGLLFTFIMVIGLLIIKESFVYTLSKRLISKIKH